MSRSLERLLAVPLGDEELVLLLCDFSLRLGDFA